VLKGEPIITIRLLRPDEADVLEHVAPDVSDHAIDLARRLCKVFGGEAGEPQRYIGASSLDLTL